MHLFYLHPESEKKEKACYGKDAAQKTEDDGGGEAASCERLHDWVATVERATPSWPRQAVRSRVAQQQLQPSRHRSHTLCTAAHSDSYPTFLPVNNICIISTLY